MNFEELFASKARAERVRRRLTEEGLLQTERFRRAARTIDVVTLTKRGRGLLARRIDPRDKGNSGTQSYRSGPACSAQVFHDTAVYRAACREMRRIESGGGRVVRIRRDSDLYASVERKARTSRKARAAAARRLGLTLHNDRVVYPDVRIEYSLPHGGASRAAHHVDVEVTTDDYRGAALQAKRAAGFRIYHMSADGRLTGARGDG